LRSKKKQDNLKTDPKLTQNYIVLVKGARFEVDLIDLKKRAIYWEETKQSEVRRCLWFYKENNEKVFEPYEEEYCEFLEVIRIILNQVQ
jgi:hypothetical protein